MKRKLKILFQGDSITDCHRDRSDIHNLGQGYPYYAAQMLTERYPDIDFEFVNLGISGNRTPDLVSRLESDFVEIQPDICSILIGVNDTWHEKAEIRNGVEVERYAVIYDMLLEWTVKTLPQIKLVLMEPFVLETGAVSADWLPEIAARGAVVKELAEKYNAVFIPCQQIVNDAAAKAGTADLILRDGVHPSLMGHQVLADAWLKYAGHLI